jgi:hypothetical protein
MSQGAYAGQPHSFACSKCRKSRDFYDHKTKRTSGIIGRRYTTTGKTRPQTSQGGNYHHWPNTAYQYRCLGCDHVGWSRHPDVQRTYRHEHLEEEKESAHG